MVSLSIQANDLGDIDLRLTWDPANSGMDITGDPTKENFTLLVDGVPRALENVTWLDSTVLIFYASGAAAVTGFRITQDIVDENVLNVDGVKATVPQTVSVDVPM